MAGVTRRRFLAEAAVAVGGVAFGSSPAVALVRSVDDAVAASAPAAWAAREIRKAFEACGIPVRECSRIEDARPGERCILAAGPANGPARALLSGAGVALPDRPECFALAPARRRGADLLLCAGSDPRGLAYALLEAADRAALGRDPLVALRPDRSVVGRPANPVRSVSRLFVSELDDKPWYYDRSFWERYLTMLASQRFNRFQLAFGLGYDFLTEVTDSYLHFAYPFLLAVPGYEVHAGGLPDAERDRNMETLRFISEAAATRGLHFQLGLWTHGYAWPKRPGVTYMIEGLTPDNHAAYCRDALRELLHACPAVSGVTLRTHGESGIPEASYAFWQTVFEGVKQCGRPIEIDLHAKGLDEPMIALALSTGMPVTIAPKYWAEHMGLPYHQAAIRSLEMPPKDREDQGFFARSDGSRRFMRYGYGDLMQEDRKYRVLFRMWPGTQRMLLWGDPMMAAAYGRASGFCGGVGADLFEPLSFKGRKGSGRPGGRDGYADASLRPAGGDWEKYLYYYRLWGRLLYDPDSDPESWRRFLRSGFGAGAGELEAAHAHCSRILPLVTTAHDPSAANYAYWPEMYTNMPIVDAARPHPYGDTPSPKRFGRVSPLDPALFCMVEEQAAALLGGRSEARYSPVEVASWLEDLARKAEAHLAAAGRLAADASGGAFRRLALDARLQIGLGRFFAAKLRAAVLFGLFERSGSRGALEQAIRHYRMARAAWASVVETARDAYLRDITYGSVPNMRGHWADRLPAIDADIADMERRREAAAPHGAEAESVEAAVAAALASVRRPPVRLTHRPPATFRRGQAVGIEARPAPGAAPPAALILHYRRVNQSESYETAPMLREGDTFRTEIPGAYGDSPFPLLYFFEARDHRGDAGLFPGLGQDLCSQPYYVVRQVAAHRG